MTDDTRPSWWTGAEQAAASQGVNSDLLWKFSGIESGYGKNIGPRHQLGPWQIMPGTWDSLARNNPSLGLTDPDDYSQHGRAAAALLRANTTTLRSSLGREPTEGEQYLTWFGGTGAGIQAIKAPADTPVTSIFSPRAISENSKILGNGMTAGGLRNWANAKMAGQHYVPGPGDIKKIPVTPTPSTTPQVAWAGILSHLKFR